MTEYTADENYCQEHQGDGVVYEGRNCALCIALDEAKSLRDKFLGNQSLVDILEERENQKAQWGLERDRSHRVADWLLILSVYLGKLGYETPPIGHACDREKARKRLAQISAIALAAVEALSEPESTGTE